MADLTETEAEKKYVQNESGIQKQVYPGVKEREEEVDTVFKDLKENMATTLIHQSCDCGPE